jgi:hypothetical protein
LATIVGVVATWARGSRIAARVVAATRAISLLMTALIFLVQGESVAPWVFVIAAAVVILDIVAIILILPRPAATLDAPRAG